MTEPPANRPVPTPGPPRTPQQQHEALTQPVRDAVAGLADVAESPIDEHAARYDLVHRVLQDALSDTDLPPTN